MQHNEVQKSDLLATVPPLLTTDLLSQRLDVTSYDHLIADFHSIHHVSIDAAGKNILVTGSKWPHQLPDDRYLDFGTVVPVLTSIPLASPYPENVVTTNLVDALQKIETSIPIYGSNARSLMLPAGERTLLFMHDFMIAHGTWSSWALFEVGNTSENNILPGTAVAIPKTELSLTPLMHAFLPQRLSMQHYQQAELLPESGLLAVSGSNTARRSKTRGFIEVYDLTASGRSWTPSPLDSLSPEAATKSTAIAQRDGQGSRPVFRIETVGEVTALRYLKNANLLLWGETAKDGSSSLQALRVTSDKDTLRTTREPEIPLPKSLRNILISNDSSVLVLAFGGKIRTSTLHPITTDGALGPALVITPQESWGQVSEVFLTPHGNQLVQTHKQFKGARQTGVTITGFTLQDDALTPGTTTHALLEPNASGYVYGDWVFANTEGEDVYIAGKTQTLRKISLSHNQ